MSALSAILSENENGISPGTWSLPASPRLTLLHMPTSYVPDEDQGILLAQVMLPTGSTMEQTQEVVDKLEKYFQEKENGCGQVMHDHLRCGIFRTEPDERHGIRAVKGLEAPQQSKP